MNIIQILTLVKTTVSKILNFCSLAWNPLFCYKMSLKLLSGIFQEITSNLIPNQDASAQTEKQLMDFNNTEPHADNIKLKEDVKLLQELSNSSIRRLHVVEKQVQKLESNFLGENKLWRTSYEELKKDQLTLKEQLAENAQIRCIHLEKAQRQDRPVKTYIDVADGERKPCEDINIALHKSFGSHLKILTHDTENLSASDDYCSITSSLTRASSISCSSGSTVGLRSLKSQRVFTPRSAMDLTTGNRVKVILSSGRIGTGRVCNVGQLPGKAEFHVGVDLGNPETCQHERHCYSLSKSGGVTVIPFSKVLMAWE